MSNEVFKGTADQISGQEPPEDPNYVEGKKKVDLSAFSKRQIIEEITADPIGNERILALSKEDYENGDSLDIKTLGLEEYGIIGERDLKAYLCKFLPKPLLTTLQHIKTIKFSRKIIFFSIHAHFGEKCV